MGFTGEDETSRGRYGSAYFAMREPEGTGYGYGNVYGYGSDPNSTYGFVSNAVYSYDFNDSLPLPGNTVRPLDDSSLHFSY